MSAATFAASAALAPASTSAASSLNRISVPRAPLSARFLRPSLSSVSPSRRGSAAATTCSKRSRRAARGIVVSPDGAGALASTLLCWCWVPCFPFPSVRLAGAPEVRRAALGAEPGCALRGSRALRALRALWVLLYAVRGAAFARSRLLLAPALGSSEGRAQHASSTPHTKIPAYQTHAQHSGPPRMCGGNLFAPVESNLSKKISVPQKTRAAPFLARFEGVVSGHARVRSHYHAPACAARNVASRASASARSRRSSVTAAAAFEASSSARAARRA